MLAVPEPCASCQFAVPDSNPGLGSSCALPRNARCPSGFVTVTVTVPTELTAGVTALIEVLLTNVTLLAASDPNCTVAPETKFVPVRVTVVPPVIGPEVGDMDESVGAGLIATTSAGHRTMIRNASEKQRVTLRPIQRPQAWYKFKHSRRAVLESLRDSCRSIDFRVVIVGT